MKIFGRDGRPSKRRGGYVLALCVLLVLPGCATSGLVARGIKGELPRVFGPADDYDVDIEGLDTGAGEAERVRASGDRVRPSGVPIVDRLEIDLRGVRYDRERKRLTRVDSAHVQAWITAADLGAFLEAQEGIASAAVTFEAPDRATVRVRPELGGLPLPPGATADVSGRIEGEGPYLRFVVSEVGAAGLRLGDRGLGFVTRLINPLVDLSDLPITLEVTGVGVEGSRVRLEAIGRHVPVRP